MIITLVCRNMSLSRKLLSNLTSKIQHFSAKNFSKPVPKTILSKENCKINFVPRRTFFTFIRKPTNSELKIKDKVPDEFMLIYKNSLNRYLFYAQVFSSVSALVVFILILLRTNPSSYELDYSHLENPPRQTDNEYIVYMTTFAFLVVIMQVIVMRVPIRIYNMAKQKDYVFVFYGNYPFMMKKLACKVGDVYPLPESNLPWKHGRYVIKKGMERHKIILLEDGFRVPADLHIMLGVQRDHSVEEDD